MLVLGKTAGVSLVGYLGEWITHGDLHGIRDGKSRALSAYD